MKIKMLVIILSTLFFGCAEQSAEKYKERGQSEQEGANQVENDNLAQKAEIMEKDLAKKHQFYSALEGEYSGTLKVDNDTFNIKFVFARSIPAYTGDRVRQLSEIESDLNNLFFHLQVVQWHPDDQFTAVGCRVSGVKPNMDNGTLVIASNDCPNLYNVFLSENAETIFADAGVEAKNVAQKIKNQEINEVPYFVGSIQPTFNAAKYFFNVKKVK